MEVVRSFPCVPPAVAPHTTSGEPSSRSGRNCATVSERAFALCTHPPGTEPGEYVAQQTEAKVAKNQPAPNVHPAEESLAHEPASKQHHARQEQPPYRSSQQNPREKDAHAECLPVRTVRCQGHPIDPKPKRDRIRTQQREQGTDRNVPADGGLPHCGMPFAPPLHP